jgi:hypothetical protein
MWGSTTKASSSESESAVSLSPYLFKIRWLFSPTGPANVAGAVSYGESV